MGSLRITGEQAQRLLTISKGKAVECYEHWDWRLRDLGLVAIGPIPPDVRLAKEKWLAAAWLKVRHMADGGVPGLAKIREMEGLLNQMQHTAYRLSNHTYSTLTLAGAELAAKGRAVILPKDQPKDQTA